MSDILNTDELFVANGVNGSTGNYGLAPMSQAALTDIIAREGLRGSLDPRNYDELEMYHHKSALMQQIWRERRAKSQAERRELDPNKDAARVAQIERHLRELERLISDHLGVAEGIDTADIAQTGWGIIFPAESDPAIEEALTPLMSLRQQQATKHDERFYRVLKDADGYKFGESSLDFTSRHGVGPGPVKPENGLPYYLLLVGNPSQIPYEFQYQLDVQFAVGRIYFETAQEYARYANNVVAAETGQIKLAQTATFFSVANQHDRATQMSMNYLMSPLQQTLQAAETDWQIDLIAQEQANKAALSDLLNNRAPALLFTASHGMEFDSSDSRQRPHQGAILCQDWPGPKRWRKPIPPEFYFAGDDLESSSRLLGLMSFHFACYGAGTPQFDEFAGFQAQKKQIAAAPFLANLPMRLLSQGALAVIGHIERAWGYSFFWPNAGEQLTVFESTLKRLMAGYPVGYAVEYLNERYAELATAFNAELDRAETKPTAQLSNIWTAHNDARNYIVIGDPAARLPLAEPGETATDRAEISPVSLSMSAERSEEESKASESNQVSPFSQISDVDWQKTPAAVRALLQKVKGLLK